MKVCSRCKKEKEDSEFRLRTDKRCKPPLVYLNNTCKECDAELQKERSRKQRATPEGRQKHNNWAKQFHQRHREKKIAYMKARRATPEYKAYMKAYREKNKAKIQQQEIITKRRYHEKNRDAITDKYAAHMLRVQGYGNSDELLENKELIHQEKKKIAIHRIKSVIRKVNDLGSNDKI